MSSTTIIAVQLSCLGMHSAAPPCLSRLFHPTLLSCHVCLQANAPGDWFQSLEQGAATTVWAAVGAEWEGRGGAYLEDCHEGKPYDENDTVWGAPGYGPHAYDQAAAERLYDITLKLLGIEE